jgi:hypothetical protein
VKRVDINVWRAGVTPGSTPASQCDTDFGRENCGAMVEGTCEFKLSGSFPSNEIRNALRSTLVEAVRGVYDSNSMTFPHCTWWLFGGCRVYPAAGSVNYLPTFVRVECFLRNTDIPDNPISGGWAQLEVSCSESVAARGCPSGASTVASLAQNFASGPYASALGLFTFICDRV